MVHVYIYIYIYIVDAGTIVLLAISFLSPFFQYIPKSALSAIIIAAVLPMVDVRIVYRIFKIRGVYFCGCLCACIHEETRKVVKQCRWQTTQQHLRQPTFGIRTHDFSLPRQVLYQLSYRGSSAGRLVGGESHSTKQFVKQFNTQSDLNKP